MTHRICLFLLLIANAFAQLSNSSIELARTLRVRVAMADGEPCDASVGIGLLGLTSSTVAEAFDRNECVVDFVNVPTGNYHLQISIHGVDVPNLESIEVQARSLQEIRINVPRTLSSAPSPGSSPLVSTADLNIPEAARKEFDAAAQFMAKENWKKAIDRLTKAVSIYPRYAEAYNNLGVAEAKLGDRDAERSALDKAIAASDHFAPAYVNLARMDIADKNFAHAEELLSHASAIDPDDALTLTLLADMQLFTRHYQQAVATAAKVHAMSHSPHALAHYVAAHALLAQNLAREALYEMQVFLAEEDRGPRADAVRKEMVSLLAQVN